MKIIYEEEIRNETVMNAAKEIMTAARTAPKGRGFDNLVIALIGKEEIKEISDKIKQMSKEKNIPAFFLRDAENILKAEAMILIGTKIKPLYLNPCGMCGFITCEEKDKNPDIPCVFNTGDLGIAIGSAVSKAMDLRIDNRIMYTVGQAVLEMKLLGEEVKIAYGIPLSVSSKNPFFDRK
ncbi:MAG: ferredoxin [Ignavibacteria bacterium]|nr:ferredoxin [Ignavibacteria bacterium]